MTNIMSYDVEFQRETAYRWHGGQWSPLYALASSGIVEDKDKLLDEIDFCLGLNTDEELELELILLKGFASSLPFDEVLDHWYAPWRKPQYPQYL